MSPSTLYVPLPKKDDLAIAASSSLVGTAPAGALRSSAYSSVTAKSPPRVNMATPRIGRLMDSPPSTNWRTLSVRFHTPTS